MENPYKDIIKSNKNYNENNDNENDIISSEEVSQNKKEINLLNEKININPDLKHCLDIVTSDLKYTLQNLNR